MLRILDGARGGDLAAPQVGLLHRLVVVRPAPEAPARVLVNPEVEVASAEQEVDLEGCLSRARARVHVEMPRARAVLVGAQDLDGAGLHLEAEGYEARLLQHEIDDLDGVLMLERAAPGARRDAVRALREHEQERSRRSRA